MKLSTFLNVWHIPFPSHFRRLNNTSTDIWPVRRSFSFVIILGQNTPTTRCRHDLIKTWSFRVTVAITFHVRWFLFTPLWNVANSYSLIVADLAFSASNDIKFDITIDRNNANEKVKLIEAFDILSYYTNWKIALTNQPVNLGFVGVYPLDSARLSSKRPFDG